MNSVEKFHKDLNRRRATKAVEELLKYPSWESYYDGTSRLFTVYGYQLFQEHLDNSSVDWAGKLADLKQQINLAVTQTATAMDHM